MAHYNVQGKVALITGAARGIGLATARALVKRGATVVLVDLDQDAVDRAAAELDATRALGMAADVTDLGALQRVVASTVERFGALDIVVANAGIASTAATFRAMSGEAFDRVIDVNLHGVVKTVRAALPEIVRNRGHVVVVASIYAFTNGVGAAPYAIAKAGVEQFGRALRVELVRHDASVSVAYFGFIDTEMVHRAMDADAAVMGLMTALPKPLLKRLAPAEAGEAIAAGIVSRAPRIIRPRVWVPMSLFRGIIGPLLDSAMERHAVIQGALETLDARAGEQQSTTE